MAASVRRRFTASVIAFLAIVGSMFVTPSTASAASGTITGSIQCAWGNNQVVGVWVDATNGKDGWASTWDNGYGGRDYSYNLSQSSSYTLHVGCGGTSQSWGSSMKAGPVNGQHYYWYCTYAASTGFKFLCVQG